jgi:hypothetical protein
MFRKVTVAVADFAVTVTFWYWAAASFATWLEMIGGVMTRVVPPAGTETTRNVLS